MPIKADAAVKGNQRAVHADGELKPVAPGILEGAVHFPVRGLIKFRMERRPNDRKGGQSARLFCQSFIQSDCEMALIETGPEDNSPDYWHGFISVEGYVFQVRAVKEPKRMAIAFIDTPQPVPFTPEELTMIGRAAA